ncbi:MAG: OmpA family protein [Candidatus Kapaibacteriales bacterium]
MKTSLLFLFPSFLFIHQVYSQSIFQKPFNNDTKSEWENYIIRFAPSDSAYRVLNYLVNSHLNLSQSLIAYDFLRRFANLFPNHSTELQNRLKVIQEYVIFSSPKPENYSILEDFIIEFAPSENAFVALQRRAEHFINYRRWDSAIYIFKKFRSYFLPEKQAFIDKIIEILSAPLKGLKIRNLGAIINTEKDEWDPCPTPDGRFLFFSARDRVGGYGKSDVFYSRNENGGWQKAQNVGNAINGPNDETIDNVTVDGTGLLLSGTFPGTFGQFDIYYIQRGENGWGSLEHLPYPINTKFVDEGASLSSDGKALVFTSDRPSGIGDYHPYGSLYHGSQMGNMDLYVTFKTDSGWSPPVNLGPKINTPFAERSPYLHPDGRTLYFSSDGHPGLGRLDVFKAVRLREDSWTEWSEPINLGKEINTVLDDWGYKISLSGDSAFFAGHWRSDGFGGWDLYSVALPSFAKPQKVATIRGKIADPNGKPLSASIKFEDLKIQKVVGSVNSDPIDGSYIIVLPLGKNYGYFLQKEGYFPSSNSIDLTNFSSDTTIFYDFILYPIDYLIEQQKKIRLNNIFFDFDKHELKPESFPELNRVIDILNKNTNYVIHIEGHTDSIGTDDYNLQLSRLRAESVRNYLVQRGIKPERIVIFGYGSSLPVSSNETEEGRALNRRVEIWFLKR